MNPFSFSKVPSHTDTMAECEAVGTYNRITQNVQKFSNWEFLKELPQEFCINNGLFGVSSLENH